MHRNTKTMLAFLVACVIILGLGLGVSVYLCLSYRHEIAVLEARAALPQTLTGYQAVAIGVARKAMLEDQSLPSNLKVLGNYAITVSGPEALCTVKFTPIRLPGDLTVGGGTALGRERIYVVDSPNEVLLRELPRPK
jgi:hypothetical protein